MNSALVHILGVDAIVESMEVRTCNDESPVHLILWVEFQWIRGTLGSGPEGLSTRGCRILWKIVKQLLNCIVVLLFKLDTSPLDAILDAKGLVLDQEVSDHLQGGLLISSLLQGRLNIVRLAQVQVDCLGRFNEVSLEQFSGPRDRVLDLVGETPKCTHREGLLRWILRAGVGFG
jgi:hypothetical protein